jgi:hypothetical protein
VGAKHEHLDLAGEDNKELVAKVTCPKHHLPASQPPQRRTRNHVTQFIEAQGVEKQ